MGASLPIEVVRELERLPAMPPEDDMAFLLAGAVANASANVCRSMLNGHYDKARQQAVKIAAASIRLVEHLDQDRP